MNITTTERQTLALLADRDRTGDLPRLHLEKFSRLDLIEPCREGVCVTVRGQTVLSGRK
jgi:hypothetical protein